MATRCKPLSTIGGAFLFAADAHEGQVDKAGAPYILHPMRVAARLMHLGPQHVIAGLLHDVVEDTAYTLEDLASLGASPEVISAVAAVTKPAYAPYALALQRAAEDPIGGWVKAADVADNYGRVESVPDEVSRDRLRTKYRAASEYLAGQGLSLPGSI
jgi:(p)ppGpp synthase/HD superfamily hydrolase